MVTVLYYDSLLILTKGFKKKCVLAKHLNKHSTLGQPRDFS